MVSEKINPKDNYYKTHPFKLDRRAASEDLKSAILSINQTLFRKEYNHVFNSIYLKKLSLSGTGPSGSGGNAALEREARVQEMGKYVDMVMNNPTINPQILADLQITDDDLKKFSVKQQESK